MSPRRQPLLLTSVLLAVCAAVDAVAVVADVIFVPALDVATTGLQPFYLVRAPRCFPRPKKCESPMGGLVFSRLTSASVRDPATAFTRLRDRVLR